MIAPGLLMILVRASGGKRRYAAPIRQSRMLRAVALRSQGNATHNLTRMTTRMSANGPIAVLRIPVSTRSDERTNVEIANRRNSTFAP